MLDNAKKNIIKIMRVYDITSKLTPFDNIALAATLLGYSLKELDMPLDDFLNHIFKNSIATWEQVNTFRNTNWNLKIKELKESED
jgi:hypothetical protein